MTYEEFKQLAEHPQHRDVPAIFKLEVLETEELEEKKRSHYPKYKVNTYCPQAFTTTLEEAERLMHQDVLYRKKMKEEDDYPLDTFCYYISEIPMGLLHYDRECLSERVYDGEGKLIDRSYCCSRFSIYYPGVCDLPAYDRHPDETFRGRNAEQIRFQKGDIVEVYRGDEVKLAIVVGTPLTTEWIWERNQAAKDKRGLDELPYDETDDSYTVIDGPGYEYHDHVPSLYVFAPHYHVPLYLQRRFKGYLEKAEKKQKEEEEKDRIFRQAHDCCFSNKEQIEKSEKCGCFFCGEIFSPSEITDYLPDEPPTAECPFCYTDSVIGDASGFPITKDFLKKMKGNLLLLFGDADSIIALFHERRTYQTGRLPICFTILGVIFVSYCSIRNNLFAGINVQRIAELVVEDAAVVVECSQTEFQTLHLQFVTGDVVFQRHALFLLFLDVINKLSGQFDILFIHSDAVIDFI